METQLSKAKSMTEEEFRSCYPDVSIQHLSDKASTKVISTIEKRPPLRSPQKPGAVAKTVAAMKTPASVKSPVKIPTNVDIKTSPAVSKVNIPAVTKSQIVTKTPIMTKTPVSTKNTAAGLPIMKTPVTTKSPAVTKTPVLTKSPLLTQTKNPVATKTPVPIGQVPKTPQSPLVKAPLSVLKAAPSKMTPTQNVKAPQSVIKQQIPNVMKTVVKPTPSVATTTTASTAVKEDSPDQSTMTFLTLLPQAAQQRSNQITIEKIDQQQRIPVVLEGKNQVVLQPVVINSGHQVLVQNRVTPAEPTLQSVVIGTTAQAVTPVMTPLPQVEITTSEPLQALQVTQQVTLFRPKGNTFTVDEVKNQINVSKQSTMTNVVSSTTNSIPAPVPVSQQAVQSELKKQMFPARVQTTFQSPVRQSRVSANVRPQQKPIARNYQSTRGQVKRVTAKRELPVQPHPPSAPELQFGNEEEVTTSEDLPQQPAPPTDTKIILILPNGEKKEVSINGDAYLNKTIQDLLTTENVNIEEGTFMTAEITNVAGCESFQEDMENEQVNWDNQEHIGPEPGEILGLHDEMDGEEMGRNSSERRISAETDESHKDADSISHEPLYRDGFLAVCKFCGYTSLDFNHCQRCTRPLPPDCKAIPTDTFTQKSRKTKADSLTGDDNPKKKKVCRRRRVEEPVCLTISDDEELLGLAHHAQLPEESFHSDSNSQMSSCDKEPVITDEMVSEMQQSISGGGLDMEELLDNPGETKKAFLQCRTVRIGSYKVVPKDKVLITPHGLKVTVPVLNSEQYVELKIMYHEIIKVLIHFGRQMPVLFFYTRPSAAAKIRNALKMKDKKGFYYDSTSSDETHRRITFLPDKIDEDCKSTLKTIFGDPENNVFAELTGKEANDILVKASPKEVQAFILKKQPKPQQQQQQPQPFNGQNIQTIMVYPPPPEKGGIPINTEDYACLGEDQFLNDVIIDFYLKYVVEKSLSPEDRARTHVFSSFFYKRLTTKPPPKRKSMNPIENDPAASPAAKRHSRVKSWTKNVDLFAKDFIVIPINENAHWFLAIICFPGLTGPVRFSDHTPIDLPGRKKKINNDKAAMGVLSDKQVVTIGSTTITAVAPSTGMPPATLDLGDEVEDRDEADGEDEDMDVPDSDEDPALKSSVPEVKEEPEEDLSPRKKQREPIKQPCILIFDSLAGASRSRVVATLRDYLRVEYEVKHGHPRDFSGEVMKGTNLRCPQQTNYTDCGLYVLQYVEAFFQWPVTDYHIPIKQLQDWFQADIVSRKRYEIQQLLHRLMQEQGIDIEALGLPLLNLRPEGKNLVDYSGSEEEDEDDEEDDEQMCEDEEDEMLDEDGEFNDEMCQDNEEMEEGEFRHDEEDGNSFMDSTMDHEDHDMDEDEEYGIGEEDEELPEEEEKELDDISLTQLVGSAKSKDLKGYRIPRLNRKDNLTENA